jgi:hypothetical protein
LNLVLQTLNETIEFLPGYEVEDHDNLTKFADKATALAFLHRVATYLRDVSVLRNLLVKEGNGISVSQLNDFQMLEVLADRLRYGRIKVRRTPKLRQSFSAGTVLEQQYMTPREVEQLDKTRRGERMSIPPLASSNKTDEVAEVANKAVEVANKTNQFSFSEIRAQVRSQIATQNEKFVLSYSDNEISDIIKTGEQLGLDAKSIEDFIFTGSRADKPISSVELIQQMNNYVNIVSKRGFPYKFDSAKDFINFKTELKDLLSKNGIPVDDICIQGSSLRTANAKDIDIAVFVSENVFNSLSSKMIKGIQQRANPRAARKIIGNLEHQISNGRINSFYFDRIENESFNEKLFELTRYMSNSEGSIDLSLMLKGKTFDVSPYLGF